MKYHYSWERLVRPQRERKTLTDWLQRETFIEKFENEIRNISSMKKLFSQEFDISYFSSDTLHLNSNFTKQLNEIIEYGHEKSTNTLGYSIYTLVMILESVKNHDDDHVANSLTYMFRIVMKFLLIYRHCNFQLISILPLRMKQLIYTKLLESGMKNDKVHSKFLQHLISLTYTFSHEEDDHLSRSKRLYFVKYLCKLFLNKHTAVWMLDRRKIEQALLHYCFCEDLKSTEIYFTNATEDFLVMRNLYDFCMHIDETALHHVRVLRELVCEEKSKQTSDQSSIWNLIQQSLYEVFRVFEQACSVQISQHEAQFEYCIKYACQRIIELVMGRDVRCFRFIDEWFALLLSCYEAIQRENDSFTSINNNDRGLSKWLGMIEHTFQVIAQT